MREAFTSLINYTTMVFEYAQTLEQRIHCLEEALLQTVAKEKRPVISSTGALKGYLHSDGTIQKWPEDC
jgi:hypothetical protein